MTALLRLKSGLGGVSGRNAPGAQSRREPQRRPEKPAEAGRGPGTPRRRGVAPVTGARE
jgi:hypothetical protein